MNFVRGLTAFLMVAAVGAAGCNGCHEEPTIVIRFEPNDGDVRLSPSPSPSPLPRPSPTPSPVAPKHAAKKECKAAADCVVEPEDCCDCANGGRQHAIAKANAAAAKAARATHCQHMMCTMMLSLDPTCGMRADCVEGECVMTKKK
jgi:hypothetical protein